MQYRLPLLAVVLSSACSVAPVTFTPVDGTGGPSCQAAADCASGVCVDGACAAATCSDGVKNGSETATDCGGSCAACADGAACTAATDCTSQVCADATCQIASCTDGAANGGEADIDCGGGCPMRCDAGAACTAMTDCVSGVCTGGQCQAASCTDRVKNGDETDLDCGGSCPACSVGAACAIADDCTTHSCKNSVCVDPSVCAANPKWQRVDCTVDASQWVWSSNRTYVTLATANAAKVLETGCAHAAIPNTCSTDGKGWVSTQVFTMAGCNTNWQHITPADTHFDCGGHDGDQYRHLSRDDNSCYDY